MGKFNKSLNAIQMKEKRNDVYYTPENFAKECINMCNIEDGDVLFDPFYGTGSFYNSFPKNNAKYFTEIEIGKDFFDFNNPVDWIISNPPFSLMNPILNHTVKLCRKGFGYIMMSTALTVPRLERLEKNGFYLNKLTYFVNREWGFGFLMIFAVFTRNKSEKIDFKYMRAA